MIDRRGGRRRCDEVPEGGPWMIELRDDALVFRFPDVHADAVCRVAFQRTLRIPDDNRDYPLPPGLGRFPLRHVDDHLDRVPEAWGRRGGVFLPMYQAEAMWLRFDAEYPMAIKVAAGKIDAVTGETWTNELSRRPQNYMAVPEQPWLDGFCVEKGLIRQFVAMPLGAGYTAEEQLTGEAEHGGLQIAAYPMLAATYEKWLEEQRGAYDAAVYRTEAPRRSHNAGQWPTWAWRPAASCARRSTRTGTASTRGTDPRVPGASSTCSTAYSSFR